LFLSHIEQNYPIQLTLRSLSHQYHAHLYRQRIASHRSRRPCKSYRGVQISWLGKRVRSAEGGGSTRLQAWSRKHYCCADRQRYRSVKKHSLRFWHHSPGFENHPTPFHQTCIRLKVMNSSTSALHAQSTGISSPHSHTPSSPVHYHCFQILPLPAPFDSIPITSLYVGHPYISFVIQGGLY
jgi:hypothetical protein